VDLQGKRIPERGNSRRLKSEARAPLAFEEGLE
jgi:hypothetical protein